MDYINYLGDPVDRYTIKTNGFFGLVSICVVAAVISTYLSLATHPQPSMAGGISAILTAISFFFGVGFLFLVSQTSKKRRQNLGRVILLVGLCSLLLFSVASFVLGEIIQGSILLALLFQFFFIGFNGVT